MNGLRPPMQGRPCSRRPSVPGSGILLGWLNLLSLDCLTHMGAAKSWLRRNIDQTALPAQRLFHVGRPFPYIRSIAQQAKVRQVGSQEGYSATTNPLTCTTFVALEVAGRLAAGHG